MMTGARNIVNVLKFCRFFLFYMKSKLPKFYKRPPLLNAPLKFEKFNKRPRRLIEVIRYTRLFFINLELLGVLLDVFISRCAVDLFRH